MITTIQKMIMKWIGIYVICHFLVQTASHEYDIQLDYERPHQHHIYNQKQIMPLGLMVDATNRLGFTILRHHTFHNHNNVAFSPCGLASVLVALFEGSDGHSSFEIYQALGAPFDRDVVRIGYRDIHRRLRSYFYQQENVLSGLSLSKENVTIRSGYESILRFYGYDLGETDQGNGGMITTTQFNRREQDAPATSTPMQATGRTTDIPRSTPPISVTSMDKTSTVNMEPTTTQIYQNKVTESRFETTTFIQSEKSSEAPTESPTEHETDRPPETTSEIVTEATTKVPEITSKEPVTIQTTARLPYLTTTVSTALPPVTTPAEMPNPPDTTVLVQTTTFTATETTRFTYPPTEDTTILPTTEMTTMTPKPTYLFTFKPITTTPLPEFSTKRFYNMQATVPPLPVIRSSDATIPKNLNSLTTLPPIPTIRLSDATIPKGLNTLSTIQMPSLPSIRSTDTTVFDDLNSVTTLPPLPSIRLPDPTIPKALNSLTTIPSLPSIRSTDPTIPSALKSFTTIPSLPSIRLPDPTIPKSFKSLTTLPPIPSIRSTDPTIPKALNSLTTIPIPIPTAIRLNPSDISSNAQFVAPRNSRTFRVKKEAVSYNTFIPLAPSGYDVPPDIHFYDPYFSYATPNPPPSDDSYFPEGHPIFATKDFAYADHHHDDEEVDQIFYLNPRDSIRIRFKVYNTILRFAYVPGIQASALELPLDSDNYSLLILVPDQQIEEMIHLLCSHLSPSLATIRGLLRDNWIKTMIPRFQLKGNVVLTGDLMKMGIHDIFEPNKADFSPMTDEFGIYARHIEQSITINIRTHANNQLRRYAQQFFDPIKVPVNRPFVFAIIDNEMDLAIMVGRVLNPLNSRIF